MSFHRLLFIMRDGPLLSNNEEKSRFMPCKNVPDMHLAIGPMSDSDTAYPYMIDSYASCLPAVLAVRTGVSIKSQLEVHRQEIFQYFSIDQEALNAARLQGGDIMMAHYVRVHREELPDISDALEFIETTRELDGVRLDCVYAKEPHTQMLIYRPAPFIT